jgi:hypothetical protein
MDARGVKRLLERTYGLAETATIVGAKSAEGALRDTRLSETAKAKIVLLLTEESLRLTLLYAGLGLALCRAVEGELENDAARSELAAFRSGFRTIYDSAYKQVELEFPESDVLRTG